MKQVFLLLLPFLTACASVDVEGKLDEVQRDLANAKTLNEFETLAEQNGLVCKVQVECLNSCQGSFAKKYSEASAIPDREVQCWWLEKAYPWTIIAGGIQAFGYEKDGQLLEQDVRSHYTGP